MADTAVQFLLENLRHLLVYNAQLILKVKDEVEGLIKDLAMLKAFIEDAVEKGGDYKVVRELVNNIRAVTYEAEDAIDTFVVDAAVHKARRGIRRLFHVFDYTARVREVASKVQSVRTEVKNIYENKMFGFEALRRDSPTRGTTIKEKKAPVVEEDNVVGFDGEATTLIQRLTSKNENLQVISLIGMGGLGKTTLAKKVYNDPRIAYEFSTHAWVYVSKVYTRKEVFLSILSNVTQVTSEISNMSDDRLAEELRRNLNWKYLIVVDDMLQEEDWDSIRMAFPNLKNGSRVLLTTRSNDVAVHADPNSPPHNLRFLTHLESWELLQKKVFGKGRCPSDLEEIGMQIAIQCDGLPLAIVVIAGMLLNKPKHWWEKVSTSVKAFIVREPDQCLEVIAMSYYHLPPHLKACFLYFGVFPHDNVMPIWKLIRLWIAEGFIQKLENVCMEDIAEEYLEDLVGRSLVLVVQRSSSGRIKTCRVHDVLRDLCLREAQKESFYLEITEPGNAASTAPVVSNFNRRLCIHSHISRYISTKPSVPCVRSFLCFSSKDVNLSHEEVSYILDVFKLLRVLHIQPIRCPRFPTEIVQEVHLKYIAISGNFKTLPAAMSSLWNLQTLIVDTPSRTIEVEADIWKMVQLRHLHTTAASRVHGPPARARKDNEDPFVWKDLQTLSTITPDSCTENLLARTPCLKKLGVRGKIASLLEENQGQPLFDNISKLEELVTLKLLNDMFPRPPVEGKLHYLPNEYKFPPNLKKLTLADTFLDWKHMSVLGMLSKLEELKLKDNAFTGIQWSPLKGGFRQLKVLQIWKTDLVRWEASAEHFPKLQHIVLKECPRLDAIPSGLGDLISLQTIKLYWTASSVASSARKILQHQQETNSFNGLKVHIYPPDL